jgi:outer membrane protein TolC
VRAALADVEKAKAVLSETTSAVIPAINVQTGVPVFPSSGFTGSPPSIFSATVQSLVYSIPQKRYIDAASFGIQAAKTRLKDVREQVALDASTAYIELDTINQELAGASEQQEFAARLVDIELQRAEAGVDPASDQLQARLTAAQIKLKRLHLEARAVALEKQLEALTGLPPGSIRVDHASIPEIPQVHGDVAAREINGVKASHLLATSKALQARGDWETNYLPDLRFGVEYLRTTTILNNVNDFFKMDLPANNFSSGISINFPLLDMGRRARAKESAAEALRAKVEAEQAEKQNDLAIADLNASIRELDTLAEIASLKQQIAGEQVKTVLTQLTFGTGAGVGPGSAPQTTPKAEQLARIDESQKMQDALDSGFDLAKARLNLLRALGHMDDWLAEVRGK